MGGALHNGKQLSGILSRPGFDAHSGMILRGSEGLSDLRPREVPQDPGINGNQKKLPSEHHNLRMRQRGQNPNCRE
jgi:hypothetical protein